MGCDTSAVFPLSLLCTQRLYLSAASIFSFPTFPFLASGTPLPAFELTSCPLSCLSVEVILLPPPPSLLPISLLDLNII